MQSDLVASSVYSLSSYASHELIKAEDIASFVEQCYMYRLKYLVDVSKWLKDVELDVLDILCTPRKNSTKSEEIMTRLLCKGFPKEYVVASRNGISHLSSLPPKSTMVVDISVSSKNSPICFLEVHSGESSDGYKHTLLKVVINTIDLLRKYMEHLDEMEISLIAFVLPKHVSDDPSFITKATVSLNLNHSLCFNVTYSVVEQDDALSEISKAINNNKAQIHDVLLPAPMDTENKYYQRSPLLKLPKKFLAKGGYTQIMSSHSIILQKEDKVYKWISHDKERGQIWMLYGLRNKIQLKYSLLPKDIEEIAEVQFFVYTKLSDSFY